MNILDLKYYKNDKTLIIALLILFKFNKTFFENEKKNVI
jgi:hypothetical protein